MSKEHPEELDPEPGVRFCSGVALGPTVCFRFKWPGSGRLQCSGSQIGLTLLARGRLAMSGDILGAATGI